MIRAGSFVVIVLFAAPVAASDVFTWVDRQGNLHATDRLGDVPEPYHSMYAAELKRRAEQRRAGAVPAPKAVQPAKAPAPASPARPAAPSIVDREIERRNWWKRTIAHWRTQLKSATEDLQKIETELSAAGLNPVLRQTPQVKLKIAEIEKRRQAALKRVEGARKMLLEDLPAKARKEQVPPKWLL